MTRYTPKQFVSIIKGLESSFYERSTLGEANCKIALAKYQEKINCSNWDDNKFFELMVFVTFYSGFRAQTVTAKAAAIKKIFNSIDKVSMFDDQKVQSIIDGKTIINHRLKIQGIIHNAKQFKIIKTQFGSFYEYLKSFGNIEKEKTYNSIAEDLKRRFKYIGEITVSHFLKDLGFNVLKPDIVLCRIFYRLGFVDSESDLEGVIKTGQKIASVTKYPIRYIDTLFVEYGQVGEKNEFGVSGGICLSSRPKCEDCKIYDYCVYKNKKKLK